jgi:hypothetical protein
VSAERQKIFDTIFFNTGIREVDLVYAVEFHGIREEPSVKAAMATIKQQATKVQEMQN